MAIVINGQTAKSTNDLDVIVGSSAISEVELKIPGVNSFTYRAWPEYDLYVLFNNTPFGKTLEILPTWTYAYRFESSPNTIYVFNANNSDGTIELRQNDDTNVYIRAQSFSEERIIYDRHSLYVYQDEMRSAAAMRMVMSGDPFTPSSQATVFLNGTRSYTFMQQGTNIVLANYSGGVLTDVHDKMKIPPLYYIDKRSASTHGTPMGDRVRLFTMKSYNFGV